MSWVYQRKGEEGEGDDWTEIRGERQSMGRYGGEDRDLERDDEKIREA